MSKNNSVQQDQMPVQLENMFRGGGLNQLLSRIPELNRGSSQLYQQSGFSQLYQQLNKVLNGYLQGSIQVGQPAALVAQAAGKKKSGAGQNQSASDAVNGKQADSKAQSDSEEQTLELSEQDVMDIVKTTSTEVLGNLKGDELYRQTVSVVDTILNRVASGKYGKGVRGVVNAPKQFSKITGPSKYINKNTGKTIYLHPYKKVQNMPEKDINPAVAKLVKEHLIKRANGENSIIGDNLFYLNPKASSKDAMEQWGNDVVSQANKSGLIFNGHFHGTPPGDDANRPKPYKIKIPDSLKQAVEAERKAEEKKAQENKTPTTKKISTAKDNPQYGFYDGVYRLKRSLGAIIPAGVNAAKDSMSVGGEGKYAFSFGSDIDAYIKEAAEKYGVPEDILRGFAHMEDGWTGKMSATGALGVGQFTQPTWDDLAKTEEGKAIGMTAIGKRFRAADDPRRDKYIGTLAMGLYAKKHADAFKAKGIPLTGENLYMAHNIGKTGFLRAMSGKATEGDISNMKKNGMTSKMKVPDFLTFQKGRFNEHYEIANKPREDVGQPTKNSGAKPQAEQQNKGKNPNTSQHVETTVGTINIVTQATDAPGISQSIHAGLTNVMSDSTGLNPYALNSGLA